MKILIADDELLTRKGLIENIGWSTLGIDEVLDAENGDEALTIYKSAHPDIILTDVRMPRMDGIALASAIAAMDPECPIIFMSGYSDKEYLKAAIKLHAVRYVEKPIQLSEVEDAITEAIDTCRQKNDRARSHTLLKREASSKLALDLTKAGVPVTLALLEELHLKSDCGTFFTLVVHVYPSLADYSDEEIHAFFERISSCCNAYGVFEIHTGKHQDFILIHFLYSSRMDSFLYRELCDDIEKQCHCFKDYVLCFGMQVSKLSALSDSYHSAVILLQNAFFAKEKVLHFSADDAVSSDAILKDDPNAFEKAIDAGQMEEAGTHVAHFYEALLNNRTFLPDMIREIYYRMLQKLSQSAYTNKMNGFQEIDTGKNMLSVVSACRNIHMLQALFEDYYHRFMAAYKESASENETSTVFLIKDYIRTHYADSSLSVKEIADHVHLSTSYLCTYFKNETGSTLNQYLAEYRMNKAKKLLSDPRNRISEISSMVGYADGNYFGKSFKKNVGMSPSEYREKTLA